MSRGLTQRQASVCSLSIQRCAHQWERCRNGEVTAHMDIGAKAMVVDGSGNGHNRMVSNSNVRMHGPALAANKKTGHPRPNAASAA